MRFSNDTCIFVAIMLAAQAILRGQGGPGRAEVPDEGSVGVHGSGVGAARWLELLLITQNHEFHEMLMNFLMIISANFRTYQSNLSENLQEFF